MATKTYYCGDLGKVRLYDHTTTTWYSVDIPGVKTLYDIMCFPNNPDKVAAVGEFGGTGTAIWIGTNVANSVSWATPTVTLYSGNITALYEVWVTDDNYVYAIGRKSAQAGPVLIKSIDGGLTFTEVTMSLGGATGWSLHFPTPSLGVIAIDKRVYYTLNGGITFIPTNGGNDLDYIVNPLTAIAFIKGIQIYEQSTGSYRITALTSDGIAQSVDSGLTYLSRFNYDIYTPLLRIGEHLTWYGNNTFWATDLTGGLICSEDGGVNWVIAFPMNLTVDQNIRGAHFYKLVGTGTSPLNQPYTEYSGFLSTNFVASNFSVTTENLSKVALLFPNNISTPVISDAPELNQTFYAVWTEAPLTTCVRLKECNGVKEIIIKDIQDQATGEYLSQKGVGASIVLNWTGGNSASPCLLATDNFPEICWTIEEIIEDCDIENFCEEVLPIT